MGSFSDYFSFPIFFLGNNVFNFFNFILGKSYFFNFLFFKDFLPLKIVNFKFFPFFSFNFFLGSSLIYRKDFLFFFNSLFSFFFMDYSLFFDKFFNEFFFFIHVVSDSLGFISSNEIGCSLSINTNFSIFLNKVDNSLIYLLGTDSISFDFTKSFLIYQGFFDISLFLQNLFLFLPVSSFIEKSSFFFNLEGKLRKSSLIFFPSFYSFSDVEIFRSFFYFKNFFLESNFSFLDFFYFINFFFYFFIDYSCIYFFDLNLKNLNQNFFMRLNQKNSYFFKKRFLFFNSFVFKKNNF